MNKLTKYHTNSNKRGKFWGKNTKKNAKLWESYGEKSLCLKDLILIIPKMEFIFQKMN
jgi:hypothetical protein